MACIIEIENAINRSINDKLPYRDTVMSREAAKDISTYLNKLWDSDLAYAIQHSNIGGYKVAINPIKPISEKLLVKQEAIEARLKKNNPNFEKDSQIFIKSKRDLQFYNNDLALMEQEDFNQQYDSDDIAKQFLNDGDFNNTSINNDIKEYDRLVRELNGDQPKKFTFGTRNWSLNKFGNYDWIDPITKQIYMRNVNLDTGLIQEEADLLKPVEPGLIQSSLDYIDSNRKLLSLENQFAEIGYDLEDLIKQLVEVKTMSDYFKIQEILNKIC